MSFNVNNAFVQQYSTNVMMLLQQQGSKLRGADRWAHEWATERQVEIDPMAAAWRRHGSRAGPLRNQDMLARGGVVCLIAFPGGRGTEDMVERATRANIPVWRLL